MPDPHRVKYFRLPHYGEDRIFHIYCEKFRIPQRYCSPKHLELIAEQVAHEEQINIFHPRSGWVDRFLRRYDLSKRKFHLTRRAPINEMVIAQYPNITEVAIHSYSDDCIISVDETNWRLLNNRMVTLTKHGTDSV